MTYVTPGHPVKDGAGYDCGCGECLYQRALKGEGNNTVYLADEALHGEETVE